MQQANVRSIIPMGFTFAALLAGFFSILKAGHGEYVLAAQLIALSMLLDGVDGIVARLMRGTSTLGAELDTFVDFCSFGIAPAVLAYEVALKNFGGWGIVMASAIVFAGGYRLARFRIVDPDRGQKGYLGLPITICAGWILLFVFLFESDVLHYGVLTLDRGPMATFVWGCAMGFVVLEVSHIRYSKPTKEPLVFAIAIVGVTCLFLDLRLAHAATIGGLTFGFIYGFISPMLPKHDVIMAVDDEDEEDSLTIHPS